MKTLLSILLAATSFSAIGQGFRVHELSNAAPVASDLFWIDRWTGSANTSSNININGTQLATMLSTLGNFVLSTNGTSHYGLSATNDTTHNWVILTNGGVFGTNAVTGSWFNLTNDSLTISNQITGLFATITNGGANFNSNVVAAAFYGNGANLSAIGIANIIQPGVIVTNGETLSIVLSNNLAVDIGHTLTASNLTAGRVVVAAADKSFASSAASGAVPVDADGSAATFAQVQALAPMILTNNYASGNPAILLSNNVQINVAHTLSLSNLTANALIKAGADNTVVSGDLSGDVTTSGTLATTLKNTGTAGTYYKTTFDGQGRETSGVTTVAMGDIVQPGNIITNNYATGNAGILLSNSVKLDIAHSLSLSNLTASRIVLSGADDSLTSAAASGAVSVDADGSATTSGQIQSIFPGIIVTNGNVNDITMSNAFRIDIAHALSVSNLTASRVVLTSAADALSSAAASGAVPIDADGSATTFAQVQALGPLIVTNGNANDVTMSNAFRIDIAHALSVSNLTASRVVMSSAADALSSAAASGAVPIDADGSAATWAQIQALVTQILTNNYASVNAAILLSNAVKLDIAHSLSLSNLTASRMVFSGADDSLGSAAASGAVPLDADGSATTWAQIQALVTQILTNNYASGNAGILLSNNVKLDIAHSLSLSNLTASRMVLSGADDTLGSAAASGAVPINADGSATTMAQVSALGTIATTSLPIISWSAGGFSTAETFIQATPNYMRVWGAPPAAGATTEANVSQAIFQQGYFTNLWWNENGIGTSTNVTCTLMTNGVASNLAATIVGTGGLINGFDSTHGVPLTASSNNISLKFTGTNPSVSAGVVVNWSIRFVSYP